MATIEPRAERSVLSIVCTGSFVGARDHSNLGPVGALEPRFSVSALQSVIRGMHLAETASTAAPSPVWLNRKVDEVSINQNVVRWPLCVLGWESEQEG